MGSLFGFVANELVDKIDILQAFLNSVETSEKFHSVKSMVQYEMDEGLLLKKGYVSGSRTLLRLHRGLNFSRMFLRRVHELGERESTVGVCKQVYKDTLANYHTFLVRTGANLAMLGMPTRDQMLCKVNTCLISMLWPSTIVYHILIGMYLIFFVKILNLVEWFEIYSNGYLPILFQVCGANKEGIEQALEVLPGMLEVSDKVYDRIQNLYASNNLLNLP